MADQYDVIEGQCLEDCPDVEVATYCINGIQQVQNISRVNVHCQEDSPSCGDCEVLPDFDLPKTFCVADTQPAQNVMRVNVNNVGIQQVLTDGATIKGNGTPDSKIELNFTGLNEGGNYFVTQSEKQEISDNTLARHTHANKTALDLVSGVNTGDQDISNLAVKSEVVHLVGEETITGGKAFSKGAIFYGQISPFPTGVGSYVAHYLSTAYNICRSLAYNGTTYVDYALGALISAKNKFSLVLKSDGKAEFGNDVSVDGELSTTTFKLNGIIYDASSFKGRYDAETVSAPANGGTLTLKNATETVISTTLTNSNSFTIALPTAIAGKVNESILIFKTGATLPTLTQPTGVVYRTETPVIAINQTWTFCYERVSFDGGLTFETYVSATKNV